MAEVRGDVHFANEPLAQEAGGHLRVEHLDRHPAMRMLLHRQEHPGHAAGADLAFDIVAGRQALTQRVEHIEHARKLAVPPLPGESRDGPLADSVPRATISSWTAAAPCGAPPTCGWRRITCCSARSEEHTSELQSPCNLVCRLLLEKKKKQPGELLGHARCLAACDLSRSPAAPPVSLR